MGFFLHLSTAGVQAVCIHVSEDKYTNFIMKQFHKLKLHNIQQDCHKGPVFLQYNVGVDIFMTFAAKTLPYSPS